MSPHCTSWRITLLRRVLCSRAGVPLAGLGDTGPPAGADAAKPRPLAPRKTMVLAVAGTVRARIPTVATVIARMYLRMRPPHDTKPSAAGSVPQDRSQLTMAH